MQIANASHFSSLEIYVNVKIEKLHYFYLEIDIIHVYAKQKTHKKTLTILAKYEYISAEF